MAARPEDLAAEMKRRRRVERTRRARRAETLRREVRRSLSHAAQSGDIQRAWLIGSLARGAFGAGSDVDIVVAGMAPEAVGPLWGALVQRLGAEVDLLRLEELPADFRERVEREGEQLVGS